MLNDPLPVVVGAGGGAYVLAQAVPDTSLGIVSALAVSVAALLGFVVRWQMKASSKRDDQYAEERQKDREFHANERELDRKAQSERIDKIVASQDRRSEVLVDEFRALRSDIGG